MRTNEEGDSLCGSASLDLDSRASISASFRFAELRLEAVKTQSQYWRSSVDDGLTALYNSVWVWLRRVYLPLILHYLPPVDNPRGPVLLEIFTHIITPFRQVKGLA
jgi:hypothetical protein